MAWKVAKQLVAPISGHHDDGDINGLDRIHATRLAARISAIFVPIVIDPMLAGAANSLRPRRFQPLSS